MRSTVWMNEIVFEKLTSARARTINIYFYYIYFLISFDISPKLFRVRPTEPKHFGHYLCVQWNISMIDSFSFFFFAPRARAFHEWSSSMPLSSFVWNIRSDHSWAYAWLLNVNEFGRREKVARLLHTNYTLHFALDFFNQIVVNTAFDDSIAFNY